MIAAAPTAVAAPRIEHVKLKAFTTLTIYMVPTLGTRFVFPFVLDASDRYVPFTLNITNPLFVSKRDPGRNTVVVTLPATVGTAHVYGDMYITVAGYEITVELVSTDVFSRAVSDVVFDLDGKARETLIQEAVAQRTKDLEQAYAAKLAGLDREAESHALGMIGELVLAGPSRQNIKQEGALTLPSGNRLRLYVDDALSYGRFTVFRFRIRNGSAYPVHILDARLFEIDPQSHMPQPLQGGHEIAPLLAADRSVRGELTVRAAALNPSHYLLLKVLTNAGTVEAQW